MNGVVGLAEYQVGGSQIRRRNHRHLEGYLSSWMYLGSDGFGIVHLSRIAQARALGWEHSDAQPMTHGTR